MDGPGHELLAGSGLAEEQHRHVRRRDLVHQLEDRQERGALIDELAGAVLLLDFLLEVAVLGLEGGPEPLDLGERGAKIGVDPLADL